MKKILLILSILGVLFVLSACVNEMIGQKITVQKRTGEEDVFEEFREVTKRKQVTKAIDIVKNANWQDSKIEMERFADYQFQFPSKIDSENKIASYQLWISPDGEHLEIVTHSDQYAKLSKDDSANSYEILTGEELIK